MSTSTCMTCGSDSLVSRPMPRYQYIECGLNNIWLKGGVTEIRCSNCGEVSVAIFKEWQLLQVIALSLFMRPVSLTGAEMRYLRKTCFMTQEELAEILDIRRSTVADRESGKGLPLDRIAEFGLRGALLDKFHEIVSDPETAHLAKSHRDKLNDFSCYFYALLGKMTEDGESMVTTVPKPANANSWGTPSIRKAA